MIKMAYADFYFFSQSQKVKKKRINLITIFPKPPKAITLWLIRLRLLRPSTSKKRDFEI